jgi:hypothetical protein
MDVVMEDIKLRIEAIRDAIKRSRLAFLVGNVVSASVVLAAWNAYFSWYRSFAMRLSFGPSAVTDEAQRELVRQWVQSRVISNSVLGISVGVSDLAFLGPIALFVTAAWFFCAVRKENHLIGALLRDTQDADADLRRLVYHAVSGHLVFITITKDDQPIGSLAPSGGHNAVFFFRPAMKLLHFLPALLILFLIAMDFITILWLPAPFSFPHVPLRGRLSGSEWLQVWLMEASAFVFFLLTYALCKRSFGFGEATRDVVGEYASLPSPKVTRPGGTEIAPKLS